MIVLSPPAGAQPLPVANQPTTERTPTMSQSTGPACGNNPNHRMSDGDRQAVEAFKAYLADRAALRDRIAEVLRPHASIGGAPLRWELPFFDGATPSLPRISGWKPLDDVVDALTAAVLPPPVSRADVPSEVVRKTLRRWAYAAGHIESELDDAVNRMYVLVAQDMLCRMADEGTEAYPPQRRWRVETFDYLAEEWVPGGTRYPQRHQAVERCQAMREKAPVWKAGPPVQRRVVRETTTYTVEAETDADEAQP